MGPAAVAAASGRRVGAEPPTIPGYQVRERLGQGGMGAVWKAWHKALDRLVALKVMKDGQDPQRFLTEARAMARLEHPNLVPIYEVGERDGRPFFAMEYLEGGSLDKHLGGNPLPPREAAGLVETLARAVAAAHRQGVVHRDLKPSNVLLSFGREPPGSAGPAPAAGSRLNEAVPKIADFGLAKLTFGDSGQTQTGAILGTPSYMAPEQAAGRGKEVGPAADLYALGAILYECLTGRPPFKAASVMETIALVRAEEPLPPRRLQPGVSRDLETICLKCLDKEPDRRYPSAKALAEDLRRFQTGEPIVARPVSRTARVLKWAKRNPALAALTVVSVAAVAALGMAAASLYWGGQVAQQRDNAEAARDREQEQRQKAETAEAKAKAEKANAEKAQRQAEKAWASVERLKYFADADRAQRSGEAGEYGRMRQLLDSLAKGRPGQPDLPGFEYRYLQRQCRLLRFLRGHTDWVMGVSWSPDGRRLATSSRDQTVRVWDAETEKEILTVKGAGGGVSWSPDGRRLASAPGGKDPTGKDFFSRGTVRIWDAESGKEIVPLQGHTRSVVCLCWSPDGKRLASASNGDSFRSDIMIKLWDTDSGKEIFTLRGHWGPVMGLSWSPDGQRLASSAGSFSPFMPNDVRPKDDTIKVWDTKSGQETLTLKGHTHFVQGVSWSPDGQRLASASWDHTVRVWDARTGGEILQLKGHTSQVHSVSWSPDGQRLASASDDQTMRVWDVQTREVLLLKGHMGGVRSVAWRPDGKRLASAATDRTVGLWDAQTGQEALVFDGHKRWVYGVSWCPDGKRLASGSTDGTVRIWHAHTGQEKRKLPVRGGASVQGGPSWSPDGKRLATVSHDGLLKVWNAESGQEVRQMKGHTSICWSPDSRRLASGGFADRMVQVWDVESGQEVLSLPGHKGGGFRGVAWSADGKRLATAQGASAGGVDGTVRVWDVESRREALYLQANTGDVADVAWSPDGRRLASACRDGTVRLWDARAGREIPEISPLRGHTVFVTSVAWSPDGTRLASASNDRTVRVWDVQTGQEALVLKGHTERVQRVVWSPDGQRLASASMDGTVRVWPAPASAGPAPPLPLKVVPPSTPSPRLVVGEVFEGKLTAADPLDSFPMTLKSHSKVHELPLQGGAAMAGKAYLIDLKSRDFDTFLRIEDANKQRLLYNDDVCLPTDLNSRIVFRPAAKGTYRLIVTTFEPARTGAYQLLVREVAALDKPIVIKDKLTNKDRNPKGQMLKFHKIKLLAGSPYTLEVESKDFPTVLILLDPTGKQRLALNMGPKGGISHIDFTPNVAATFVLVVGSYDGRPGEYSLAVQRYDEAVKQPPR
jgi:WD40 repeat protein